MGRYKCIQPLYYFVLRTSAVPCSWRLVPARLCLLCSSCQHLRVDHRTVPAKTLERHAVTPTGLLLLWIILFVQTHISRTSIHGECFAVCWNFCSIASCKNGLAPVLPGNTISLPKLYLLRGQTWTAAFGYPMLLLISKKFQAHASNFNEDPSSNCFKFMVSSNEIFTWPLQRNIFAAIFCILNMSGSNSSWRII